MRILNLILVFLLCLTVKSQTVNRTQILTENIKTLQVKVNENPLALPVITLNGDESLQICFDEMSHEIHSYSYTVQHCDADWKPSNLSSTEYLAGFTTGNIDNYSLSVNTTFLYTHYAFQLPNNDMQFIISGNYVVNIYEDNKMDKLLAKVCFSIIDPNVQIDASVRYNTDTELSGSLQQVDFTVMLNNYVVQDPQSEFKIVVRQNNRIDNQVNDIKSTYFSNGKLSYVNNRNLIFEGGNEYHRFDISSIYSFGQGVSGIHFVRPYYEAALNEDYIRAEDAYVTDFDVNGKYLINLQNSLDNDTEADYMYVNFYLDADLPFLDGQIYAGGEWNYNQLNETSCMKYDTTNRQYCNTVLLKQGGYNYQYWYLPKNGSKASTKPVEGSHWQTGNEYAIYVYHRPWQGRYDKLVGVKIL